MTFSANERLIDLAREKARAEKRSLNDAFREWLERYARTSDPGRNYRELMKKLSYVEPGRKFSREEMNERR